MNKIEKEGTHILKTNEKRILIFVRLVIQEVEFINL